MAELQFVKVPWNILVPEESPDEWAVTETLQSTIIGFLFKMVLCIVSGQVDGKLLSVIGGKAVMGLLDDFIRTPLFT